MGFSSVLDIAKSSLLASQAAIQTVSHNLANLNTPGYTRQRINLSAGETVLGRGYYLGSGVKVAGVERIYDRFLNLQILGAAEMRGRYTALKESLARLEGIFNDAQGLGLSDLLNEFFSSLQKVSNDPASYSARTVFLGKARNLTQKINSLDLRLKQELENLQAQIKFEVEQVNSLTSRIAGLNVKIQQLEVTGKQANDLRDERDLLVSELAEKIEIRVLEENNSYLTILAPGGDSLVSDKSSSSLKIIYNPDNNNYYDISLGDRKLSETISSGKLKGLFEARDTYYQDALDRLEIFSASLTKEFNLIHRQGYGLDSSTGLALFAPLLPSVRSKIDNTGGAKATVSLEDLSLVTLDEYEIRFTSDSSFEILNITKGRVVSAENNYLSGAKIDFDGIRMVISDDTDTPKSGDIFKLSVTRSAAMNFALNFSDPNKFAAAKDALALPGDNSNVLEMVNLENLKPLAEGNADFSSFYAGLVADLGAASNEASINSGAQELVLKELNSYRESVSGVSLDEEAANLLKYQHAYQAAAKVITTVDSMLETLINLK